MSLLPANIEHAENGPETWRVEKITDGRWALVTKDGDAQNAGDRIATFNTRKQAETERVDGWAARLWEKERRWYAGESIPGWKSYAECKAEQVRAGARWAAMATA